MHNSDLVQDYIKRSGARLKAIEVLMHEESWADVVRESQEVVELCLKALLRSSHVETPRVHDVSSVLLNEKASLPKRAQKELNFLIKTSKELRRDRELAFYGSEDLTPSEFYSQEDAEEAFEAAKQVHRVVDESVEK